MHETYCSNPHVSLPTHPTTCYNTTTMKNKTIYNPNITVYVGRSEQREVRNVLLIVSCRSERAKRPPTSYITFCRSNLPVATRKSTVWMPIGIPRVAPTSSLQQMALYLLEMVLDIQKGRIILKKHRL